MPKVKAPHVHCEEGFRHCYRCKTIKPLEQFARHRSKPGGYGYCCKECNRTVQHKWRTDYPDRKKGSDKKYVYKNKEKRRAYQKEYAQEWRKKHFSGNAALWENHGITQKQFEEMLQQQDGKCAICGTQTFNGRGKRAHVDHCHETGKIRGLLCIPCNSGLGFYERFKKHNLIPVVEQYLSRTRR